VLDDATFDVWGSIQPLMENAIGRALDAAVFFGVNKPASWPTDINAAAVAAGNTRVRGTASRPRRAASRRTSTSSSPTVEVDGFSVDGLVAKTRTRRCCAAPATSTATSSPTSTGGTLYGEPLRIVAPGLWPTGGAAGTNAEAFALDASQFVLGVRQDFTYKLLDQAVITDAGGLVQYNLPQQDMVAMRVVFRVAWQVANTINYEGANDATQYPAAVMRF
jgi:hypothetical protein